MKKLTFLIGILITMLLFSNCKKDDDTTTETITVRDTITVHDTILNPIPADTSTIIFLLRHAETEGGGSNPHLSTIGNDRANKLANMLKNNPIEAVYSTSFFRTEETAKAVADEFGLTVINYDASKLNDLADDPNQNYVGKRVVVVGHSNTTPELLNMLTNTSDYQNINETEYDNLYILNKNTAETVVTHLKY